MLEELEQIIGELEAVALYAWADEGFETGTFGPKPNLFTDKLYTKHSSLEALINNGSFEESLISNLIISNKNSLQDDESHGDNNAR